MRNRKRQISVIAALLAMALILPLLLNTLPGQAQAASRSELEQQKAELEAEKKEIDEKIAGLESQLSENRDNMQAIIDQKNLIDQEIFMLHEQVNNLNEQIATYNLLIAEKQAELDAEEARLEQLNTENKERIRAMEENGNLSYWSVLFKANSFAELLDYLNMIEEIAAADRRRLDEIAASAAAVAAAKATLEEERAGLEATKAELAETQKKLEVRREEANQLLTELIAIGAEYEALLHDAEIESAAIGSDLDKTNAAIDAMDKATAATNPATPPPGATGSVVVDGLT